MMGFTRALGAAVFVFAAVAAPVLAADNPELSARLGASDKAAPLSIGKLDIAITVIGDTAHTVVTVQFLNPEPRQVEGEFVFDLPHASVVTGYALNVGDRMIDGVLVGERQARVTYENRVRHGVDPGLAEVTRSGAFKTHVFPILPGNGRTIRLSFDTPIESGTPYLLPLHTTRAVGEVTVHIDREAVASVGAVCSGDFAPQRAGENFFARCGLKGKPLTSDLTIWPSGTPPVLLARHSNSVTFFEINDAVSPAAKAATAPDRVRIYWDSSLSRRDADLKSEIALVGKYIAAVHPAHVDLVFFAAGVPQVRSFAAPKPEEIEAVLKVTDYQGGTSLKSLFTADLTAAGTCLLFSDGNVTADGWRKVQAPCPLFTVTSVRDANRPLLALLAKKSGGAFVDLTATALDAALQTLQRQTPAVADVRAADGSDVDFVVLPAEGNRIRIVGRLPDDGDLTVKLARSAEASRHYKIDRSTVKTADTLGSLWAIRHIDDMLADEHPDRDAVVEFSRRYSVASTGVSFVVFEILNDYVEAGVEPPLSAGKDVLDQYRRIKAAAAERKAKAERDRLDKIAALWDEQKRWWQQPRMPEPEYDNSTIETVAVAGVPASTSPPPPPPPPPPAPTNRIASDVQTVTVTGMRASAGAREPQGPTIEVQIADWNPDRAYIKALTAAQPENYWYVYREQEKTFGTQPSFYLDVAEFMFRHQRAADAIRIVLNALELPSADVTTQTIVADRLMRYGDTARAVWLYERILFLEGDRPQPRRNLALALAAEADHTTDRAVKIRDDKRALELLGEIITHDWQWEFNGIEVISLMEANRIAAKLKGLGVKEVPLDKRLIALLDVDLRIVMEWNTDGTDMDLWVDEPTGERCIYSHRATAIGGRLSNDMRNGYGPEEYLLHKAPNGTYTVRVNVFASDRLNPNGATTIKAHIFRNWGRADEQEQVLEIELSRSDKDAHVVGTVKVTGSSVKLPAVK